jgi:hypothetical protein
MMPYIEIDHVNGSDTPEQIAAEVLHEKGDCDPFTCPWCRYDFELDLPEVKPAQDGGKFCVFFVAALAWMALVLIAVSVK